MFFTTLLSLLPPKIVLPPVLRIVPVCYACHLAWIQCAVFIPPATGNTLLWTNIDAIMFLPLALAHVLPARIISQRVADPTLWWKLLLMTFSRFGQAAAGAILIERAPTFSDAQKTLYILFVHPLIFEFFLTLERLIVRSLTTHHESAAWVPLSVSLASKMLLARFWASLIRRPDMAFVASWHVPIDKIASEDWRDRQLYRLFQFCCGSRASRLSNADGSLDDPTKFWRNASLSERLLQAEVVLNIVFTVNCGFLIWWLDISIDGLNPPEIGDILSSVAIQWLDLCAMHFVDVFYTEVVSRSPMVQVVHLNFRGYRVPVGAHLCCMGVVHRPYTCCNTRTRAPGHQQHEHRL
jgi:hypothetical protein